MRKPGDFIDPFDSTTVDEHMITSCQQHDDYIDTTRYQKSSIPFMISLGPTLQARDSIWLPPLFFFLIVHGWIIYRHGLHLYAQICWLGFASSHTQSGEKTHERYWRRRIQKLLSKTRGCIYASNQILTRFQALVFLFRARLLHRLSMSQQSALYLTALFTICTFQKFGLPFHRIIFLIRLRSCFLYLLYALFTALCNRMNRK